MGYKNKSKEGWVKIRKKSKLAIHKDLPEFIFIRKDIDLEIQKTFSYIETEKFLSLVFGDFSIEYNYFLSQIEDSCSLGNSLDITKNYFKSRKVNIDLQVYLEAYYQGSSCVVFDNLHMDIIIKKDLNSLNRKELGYLLYEICSDNYLSDLSAYNMLSVYGIDEKTMKDKLKNEFFLKQKYLELKRPSTIDWVLN